MAGRDQATSAEQQFSSVSNSISDAPIYDPESFRLDRFDNPGVKDLEPVAQIFLPLTIIDFGNDNSAAEVLPIGSQKSVKENEPITESLKNTVKAIEGSLSDKAKEYMRSPSIWRIPSETPEEIRVLKETVGSLSQLAQKLGSDCLCPDLAKKLFLDPKTGRELGIHPLLKEWRNFENLCRNNENLSDSTRASKAVEILNELDVSIFKDIRLLENHYLESVGEDGKKLAEEFKTLRQKYRDEKEKSNGPDGRINFKVMKGEAFEHLKAQEEWLKKNEPNSSEKLKSVREELGKYPKSIHDTWDALAQFSSSEKGFHASRYVTSLEELHSLHEQTARLLKECERMQRDHPEGR